MYNVHDFIGWAMTHAKGGAEPWQYLFGSVRVKTTQDTLDLYFSQHYRFQMTRVEYDQYTADWDRNGYATDCQGLCDAYLTYECNDPTDINADMNYNGWCTDKGLISAIERDWKIGEAVFRTNGQRMTHVGWICGFDADGCPLVVEAQGIREGVRINRLRDRSFTHRGLMTKKFEYSEATMIKFEQTSPMLTGNACVKMQDAMNAAGYRDAEGKVLVVDGKWGRRSQEAFDAMLAAHSALIGAEQPAEGAEVEPVAMYTAGDKTICVFRTEDLPEA